MNPLLTKVLISTGRWLIKLVGLEPFLKWLGARVESGVDGLGERQKAIAKARSINDGRFGSTIIDGRARWVVYSGDTPRAVFPSLDGDLVEEMRDYDVTKLRKPDELRSRRARAWARSRLWSVAARLRRAPGDVTADEATGNVLDLQATADSAVVNRGRRVFEAAIERFPQMLEDLSGGAGRLVGEAAIPAAPGVYLLSEGPTPRYVGNARDLRQRLRQHTGTNSRENEAALAWRIAVQDAEQRGLAVTGTRKQVEVDAEFAEVFTQARERVMRMDVRFIEIDDPIVRTLFEVYAAQALETDALNSFETD